MHIADTKFQLNSTKLAKPLKDYHELFLEQLVYDFDTLKLTTLTEDPGVYAIYDKVTGRCLYVGRAVNLRRRLYTNHLHGNLSTARLKKYLINDGIVIDVAAAKEFIKDRCNFRVLALPKSDHRLRGKLEAYLTGILDCYYIQKEH